jgi:tetratricopeptide (TPR) repeat protein
MYKALSIAAAICVAALAGAQKVHWSKSLQEAKAEAARTGKPVFIEVYTDWSSWCKQFERNTLTDKGTAGVLSNYVCVRLNAEKQGESFAKSLAIRSFPTLVFMEPNGHIASTVQSFLTSPQLVSQIKFLKLAKEMLDPAEQRLAQNPKDAKSAEMLAYYYAKFWQINKALPKLELAATLDPTNTYGYVAKAFNATGDYFQLHKQYAAAIRYFDRGRRAAKTHEDRYYAYISIASCYLEDNQRDKAKPWLNQILAMNDATRGEKDAANKLLISPRGRMGGEADSD